MDVETVGIAVGSVFVGGLAAASVGAWWWGRKLKGSDARNSRLDHARQFAEQQGGQVRKQVEQLQKEVAELRQQLARAKPRSEVHVSPPPPSREELENMLLRAPPSSQTSQNSQTPEVFPDTQIIPRKR